MCYNSIERQIVCVDRLIDCVKQVKVDASTIQYQVMTRIQALRELGLPTDLVDNYLNDEGRWKHVLACHEEIEERIDTRDMPYLFALLNHLEEIRRIK